MNSSEQIVVTLQAGRRVDAQIRQHTVKTDQPKENGGDDAAPSPFELFLASLATCAGLFVQAFCAKRGLSTNGIRLLSTPTFDVEGTLTAVELTLELPLAFPEKYRDAVVRVAEQCSVKRAIAAQPVFRVLTTTGS